MVDDRPVVYDPLYEGSKIIETANYGIDPYENSLDCQWKIEVDPSKIVKLIILGFETELEYDCGFSTMKIKL